MGHARLASGRTDDAPRGLRGRRAASGARGRRHPPDARRAEQNPCLSPDGGTLLFTRFLRGYNRGPAALVLLDLASGDERVLVPAGDHDHVDEPGRCFSPDGRLVAYASDERERDEIWVLDLQTGDRTRLTDRPGQASYEPTFTRDGQWIVFQSAPEGDPGDLYRIRPDGTGEERIVGGDADDREPNASPVADEVVFQSDRGGTWGLWTVPVDGGTPKELRDTRFEETDASYAPASAAVVLATDERCSGLSCPAVLEDGELEVFDVPEHWYEGAPALGPDGALYVEGTDGNPERGRSTAIWLR